MSKKQHEPVLGRDYDLLDNGVIAVRRCFSCVAEPYNKKDKPRDYLSLVDHGLRIKKKESYKRALLREEVAFNKLVRKLEEQRRSLIIVMQGRDAAGKSGACERILHAVDYDHKIFAWIPIGPPTEDERAHPHLWRFMTGERMPKFGQVRGFDRSWHERVLVELVKKLASRDAIKLSYAELRTFEWLLRSQGAIICKFWLDISKDEQLSRFKARAASKPWKLSAADKDARKQWDGYTDAANEMFHRTGTDFAPWYIVSSEDKRYSRVTVLQTINQAIREQLS